MEAVGLEVTLPPAREAVAAGLPSLHPLQAVLVVALTQSIFTVISPADTVQTALGLQREEKVNGKTILQGNGFTQIVKGPCNSD